MTENYILAGFREMFGDMGSFYQKNKAHIFTGLGIVGTIGTGVLSARDGAKAARRIDRKKEELGRELTFKEKMQLCWKDYIDAALIGGLACFSEFKSDQINTRTIADRTALLIASEKAYEKLSQKTREVLGDKKAKQVQDEVVKEELTKANPATGLPYVSSNAFKDAPRVGNGELHPFIDAYTKLPVWSNIDYLRLQEKTLQEMMSELRPRDRTSDYVDKIVGVRYSEWLSMLGYSKDVWGTDERREQGWNKGCAGDGSDDDPIEFYTTPIEFEPGFAVTSIIWKKNPTSLRLGRLIKTNGL